MTTRTYYLPRNRFSLHVLNRIVTYCGCSIGELKVNRQTDTIRAPITCNDSDINKVERILYRYGMIDEEKEE